MRRLACLLPLRYALALACLLGSARAGAQFEEEEPSGAYTHDGVLLRLTIGPAAGFVTEHAEEGVLRSGRAEVDQFAIDVSGAAYAFGLDAGYSMSPSFAWHVRLSQCVLPDPALDGETPLGRGDTMRTLALLGPGLSYFGPYGLYAAAVFGVGFARTQAYEGQAGLGDPGIGANLDLGIEFWAGEQLALGGVFRGWYSRTGGEDRGLERSQQALAIAFALSATYH